MPDQSPKTGPAEPVQDELSWLTPEPNDKLRIVVRSFRLSAMEGARLDDAAKAVGMTTSAYVRSRMLNPGPDVAAWRAVYARILRLAADCDGTSASSRVKAFKDDFERIARSVPPPESE